MPENNENQSTKQEVLCSAEPINMGSGQKQTPLEVTRVKKNYKVNEPLTGQTEIKPTSIKNPCPPTNNSGGRAWKIFFWEAFLFSLTLGLGIATAFRISRYLKIQEITIVPLSFWKFILYFLLATFFIFFLSFLGKSKKGKGILFKSLFLLAVFWGGVLFLSLWVGDLFALAIMLILIFWWLKWPSIISHDLCIIFGITGVGGLLGLRLSPPTVVVLLIIFSIYDFIAVYKTKHMVRMAKEMVKHGAILGFLVPQKISDFRARLKEVRVPAERVGGKFLVLGGGDVVFPLLLAVSLVAEGVIDSAVVVIFALIGLFASFYIFNKQKIRQPIPALPPIAIFSIIGFLITLLI